MTKSLTLACGDYDLTRALRYGTVQPEGIDLTYVPLPPAEIFWRMIRFEEFDASEMSLSAYILMMARGEARFTAIPVFPSRMFRHSALFVRNSSPISSPAELKGLKVGVPEYHMTAALWIRGLLQDEYGIAASDVEWFQGGQEAPGRTERVTYELPGDIKVNTIGDGKTLNAMLASGEVDVLATPMVPPGLGTDCRRIFEDPWQEEMAYYGRTGIFPIMHVVVVKADVYDKNPWIAQSLFKAFEAAKAVGLQTLHNHAPMSPLPFYRADLERTLARLGGERLFDYGVDSNRAALEAAVRYSYEQGLSDKPLDVDQLFAPNTLTSFVD